MKKMLIIAGLIALVLIGSVFVLANESEEQSIHKGFFGIIKEKLGLPEDATREEVNEAMQENKAEQKAKFIEGLDLPEGATEEEIKVAILEKKGEMQTEYFQIMKEKLGLPADATEEEVKIAIQNWKEENKELLGAGCGKKFHGFRGKFGLLK